MTARLTGLAFACLACTLSLAHAATLDEVLNRMDQSAKDFKSFAARIKRTEYEKFLDDSTDTFGVVRMQRNKGELIGVIEDDGGKVNFFEGRTATVYAPKANSADIIDLGKQANLVQQMILLGFGTRRADLEKNYTVTLGGVDTVGTEHTTRIELTPKSKDEKDMVARIQLWIPDGQGYPIQEKILLPSKSYKEVLYSDMKLPAPPNTSFKLVMPADVHKNYPQK
jgi:outer membrane lipoprotein-sorting protein